ISLLRSRCSPGSTLFPYTTLFRSGLSFGVVVGSVFNDAGRTRSFPRTDLRGRGSRGEESSAASQRGGRFRTLRGDAEATLATSCRGRFHRTVGAPPWLFLGRGYVESWWARGADAPGSCSSGVGSMPLGLASLTLTVGLHPTAVAGRVHPKGQVDRLHLCPCPGIPHGLL